MKRKQAIQRMDTAFYGFLAISILLCVGNIILFDSSALAVHYRNRNGVVGDTKLTKNGRNPPPLPKHTANRNIPRKEAIAAFRAKFEAWKALHPVCPTRLSPMNFSSAIRCGIRPRSTGGTSSMMQYPSDAEEHFAEIHSRMAEWGQHDAHHMHKAANYSGPWIENYWIDVFLPKALASPCLRETFGIYVPLFLPWVDIWVANKFHYPDGFVDTLLGALRPDVAYVTVSQGDMGISGYRELPMKKIPNVLVLSAGGYGHVPIPLLKEEEFPTFGTNVPPSNRPYTFVYTGSLEHAPNNLRKKMHDNLLASDLDYTHYYGEDWRRIMRSALFNLVPRGYGRSAYHLMEALQSNCVPIYVYSDEPWLPYQELFDSIGYKISFEELPNLANQLASLPRSAIDKKEKRIALLRRSHFSYAGTIQQIGLFLKDGAVSDLNCQTLPKSPR